MKVLIVDDSKTMRTIEKNILGKLFPCDFVEAGDGNEALVAIASNPSGFDFIMIDWNMPVMDGITLVRKIREKDKSTKLIMCTTEAEKTRVVDALKAGVNNYVVKPFTPEALLERVKSTLDKVPSAA